MNILCVIEAQVIQHTLHNFEIRLVVSQPPSLDELELIRRRLRSQLGDINITINVVPEIERSANGKFKAVISHVKNDRNLHKSQTN